MTTRASGRMLVRAGAIAMLALATSTAASAAQQTVPAGMAQELPPPAQIFTLLFLMLGPFKIIGPFAQLTKNADNALARRIAWVALLSASAALLLAGFVGRSMLESYRIPVPVMALSGGLILFLVALKNLLQQFEIHPDTERSEMAPPDLKVALMPLAFPIIVTPYGVAALVVLMALSADTESRLQVGGIVVAIMLANLAIMMLARKILPIMGIVLPILGAVLGVVQVALGLQIIRNALLTMGIL
jgi:multiple antibiotic resistance protein